MGRPKLNRPNFKLKLRGGTWVISYTQSGRTKTVSTGCAEHAAAEVELARFEADWDRMPEPEAKTVAAILAGYLHDREHVVADYQRRKELAANVARHLGWIDASALLPSNSRTYAITRRKEGVSDGTIRLELGALRAALKWAKSERWLTGDVPAVKLPPAPPPRDRWLTREEADRLLSACVSPHMRLFVTIALHTAARKGAIAELQWQQVDFERGLISFNPPGRRQTSKRRVTVPINATLRLALAEAANLRTTDHVLEWGGQPAGNIKKAFERAARRAGLAGVTPNVLRHTAASWMAMQGIDMQLISRYLGHTDLSITNRVYAHMHPDYLKSAAEALE